MLKTLFRHLFLSVAAWLFCKALLPSEILLRLATLITVIQFPGELMDLANSFSTKFPHHQRTEIVCLSVVYDDYRLVVYPDSVDPGRSFSPMWIDVIIAADNSELG